MSNLNEKNVVTMQNDVQDVVSSEMLVQLAKQLERRGDCAKEVELSKTVMPHEKCELSTLLSFVFAVGSGLAVELLWSLMKAVYDNISHPKDYEWKVTVKADKPLRVTIREGKTGAEILVEEDPE